MQFNLEPMTGGGGCERTKLTIELGDVIRDGSGVTPAQVIITKNGVQVGEVLFGIFSNQKDLEREIAHARRLEYLPRAVKNMFHELTRTMSFEDHINTSPKAKREAWFRGFLDGMGSTAIDHGCGTAKAQKDHTPAYSIGFENGKSLAYLMTTIKSEMERESP